MSSGNELKMQLKEGIVLDLIKPLVTYINNVLTKLMPTGEIYIVMLASGLLAYYIKNKYNWGKIAFIITATIIYGFFRFISIGG